MGGGRSGRANIPLQGFRQPATGRRGGGPPPVYTLAYSLNGGGGTQPVQVTGTPGQAVALAGGGGLTEPDANFVPGGHPYYFDGWNTLADGSGANYAAGASYTLNSSVTLYAKWAPEPDLMVKFGKKARGYSPGTITAQNVTDTFNAVQTYIQGLGPAAGQNPPNLGLISMADFVQLPSLLAPAVSPIAGAVSITAPGDALKVMVVGINSYYNINGNGTDPHLVFQFMDAPCSNSIFYGFKMNSWDDSSTGYWGSELRDYLINDYWTAVQTAGVPDGAVWAVNRVVASAGGGGASAQPITDKLYLPTEWEMFGFYTFSDSCENSGNQGRFGYYTSNLLRAKSVAYWLASPDAVALAPYQTDFCAIGSGDAYEWPASYSFGILPAFTVK
ncbi:MAG: hypothetical protein Pg6C_11900 [Treponemataceae bacterium]|nr:MAG: hypothetical protein Pg6C_11900 [Treponemataceae bacterium]